jgi:hypothetical protein
MRAKMRARAARPRGERPVPADVLAKAIELYRVVPLYRLERIVGVSREEARNARARNIILPPVRALL